MRLKAQAATEYMLVVMIALAILTPIIISGGQQLAELRAATSLMQGGTALDAVREAADLVYAQGAPAKLTVGVEFPPFIRSSLVSGRELVLTLDVGAGPTDIVRVAEYNLTGELPASEGYYQVTAEAVRSGGQLLVDVSWS